MRRVKILFELIEQRLGFVDIDGREYALRYLALITFYLAASEIDRFQLDLAPPITELMLI